ncbi:HEAT repeat domain-containing protein [Fuerstiella marisgermanici]|uniref:HEAT repeat protein n=1 Tax=Fuerstiella marisgermanici TaxID=1891926 RepID=A0A1P8WHX1_9PLAN|nr:hypothetical protein [Fuerstiella marisgermanici]APZ93664.1 hypothetical protein Fuma_03282 [Fuerstiella marisgermanici]
MTEPANDGPDSTSLGSGANANPANSPMERPLEELPPVEPPSAGFIVQLFLIPALIVAAVIGVWALFGKLAESETDWQQLVTELGSSNEHRRWRAALGLAQVLRNQQIAPDKNGTVLAEEPAVAEALTKLLKESLESKSTLDDDIKHQEFLARTLGSLQADDIVLPVLAEAMQPDPAEDSDRADVRKSSLMSVAMIAGRHFERQAQDAELITASSEDDSAEETVTLAKPLSTPTIADESVLKQLKLAAQDEEASIRHLAAYTWALVSGDEAIKQLELMLLDADEMTRANAAIGLARNGQTDGLPVLIELLELGTQEPDRSDFQNLTTEQQQEELTKRQFEQPIILANSLRAIGSLESLLTSEQREQLKPIVETLSSEHSAANIRMQAGKLAKRFNAAE